MERPNFDFNFDLDLHGHQKEMEEMSKKPEKLVPEQPNFYSIFIGMARRTAKNRWAKGMFVGPSRKHKTKDAILAT